MIELLSGPSVCLIDDEAAEFGPMQEALTKLNVGWVHFRGDSLEALPSQPIRGVRAVFLDLHLDSSSGKNSIDRTVQVFTQTIAVGNGPLLLVVWSKYARDPVTHQVAQEVLDFKDALKAALGEDYERIVIMDLVKPYASDRPDAPTWIEQLQGQIKAKFDESAGLSLLWIWESMARKSTASVGELLTSLALAMSNGAHEQLDEKLKVLMRLLAQEQGGPDCSDTTAVKHLSMTLAGLGQDNMENTAVPEPIASHGTWLCQALSETEKRLVNAPTLNGMLMTATPVVTPNLFTPGMVYDVTDFTRVKELLGYDLDKLKEDCFKDKVTPQTASFPPFKEGTSCVAVEVTPACDFHQANQRSSTLVLGLVGTSDTHFNKAKRQDSCKTLRMMHDRFSNPPQNVWFVFCATYRMNLALGDIPEWLKPRLRLRDLVVTDLRNWASAQSSRVGYLSV